MWKMIPPTCGSWPSLPAKMASRRFTRSDRHSYSPELTATSSRTFLIHALERRWTLPELTATKISPARAGRTQQAPSAPGVHARSRRYASRHDGERISKMTFLNLAR